MMIYLEQYKLIHQYIFIYAWNRFESFLFHLEFLKFSKTSVSKSSCPWYVRQFNPPL